MIGKIIAVAIFGLVLIAITGVDATKYYQDFIMLKNNTQSVVDNSGNKIMVVNASNFNLRNEIFQIIGQD